MAGIERAVKAGSCRVRRTAPPSPKRAVQDAAAVPLPRRAMFSTPVPPRGDIGGPAPRFRDHFARYEQPQLDANAGKADPLAARLRARGRIVISGQLPSLMPRPSSGGERSPPRRLVKDADVRGAGVEGSRRSR